MPTQRQRTPSTCGASTAGAVISAAATGFFWCELTLPLLMRVKYGDYRDAEAGALYAGVSVIVIGLMGCVGWKAGAVTRNAVTHSINKLHTLFSRSAESEYLSPNTASSVTTEQQI